MSKHVLTLLIGAALAGLAATPSVAGRDSPDSQLQKLLAGRVVGEQVDCIRLTGTTRTTIVEGKAIVYRIGSRLWLNVPRSGADSLNDDDDDFLFSNAGNRVCSGDRIRMVHRSSGITRSIVVLGRFMPYTKATT